jgi:IS30 family transposase
MGGKRRTVEQQAVVVGELLRLYESGLSVKAAARVLHFDSAQAGRLVREAGLTRRSGRPRNLAARARFARLIREGLPVRRAAAGAGVSQTCGQRWVRDSEVMSSPGEGSGRYLGLAEREVISQGRAAGWSLRRIAGQIGRPVSTVSRELKVNSDPDGRYWAWKAQDRAQARARRPKPARLAAEGPLRQYVSTALTRGQSPEQISKRLAIEYPDDPDMRVSMETIYQAVYVLARGGLKRELVKALRTGRTARKPHRTTDQRRGRIPGMVPIADRPEEADDRIIPGHWEGDLIIGKNTASAIGTLVERTTGFVMLAHLPTDHTAASVHRALVPLIGTLPDAIRRTLTWDQGSEMACHQQLTIDTGIDVYFADPHSPWQRGSNENTNGLLRQYFPKSTDLQVHGPSHLADVSDLINSRPRKRLGWLTPIEAMSDLLDLGLPRQRLFETDPPTALHLTDIPKTQPLTNTIKTTQRCDDH